MEKVKKHERDEIDPQAWVDEFGDYLFRFAQFRVRRREIAEELVQETFLAAWKGLDRFRRQVFLEDLAGDDTEE